MSPTRFQGRIVLITGASRGLGAGLAHAFAREGAHVVLGYRVNAKRCALVLQGIEEAGGAGSTVQLDVTDTTSVRAALDQVRPIGEVDVLVNNADLTHQGLFAMDDAAAWEEVVQVNLLGAARCARAVAREMVARRSGVILNVGSIAALRASPGQTAYAAAKGGLISLTRALAAELAPHGVRVNALVPGMLDTGMAARMPREVSERWVSHTPAGRRGTIEDVAPAALFLASDEARFIIGQSLVVDGGLSL